MHYNLYYNSIITAAHVTVGETDYISHLYVPVSKPACVVAKPVLIEAI